MPIKINACSVEGPVVGQKYADLQENKVYVYTEISIDGVDYGALIDIESGKPSMDDDDRDRWFFDQLTLVDDLDVTAKVMIKGA